MTGHARAHEKVRAHVADAVRAVLTVDPFPMDGSVYTLGWSVAEWIEDNLVQPDGDDAGEPFRLTREQLNFILWFYAVDARGKFVYRRAVLRRSKGWGKSPFLGAIALAELCGPVRFGGWDADGEPIAVAHPAPWVVIAGVSETQTENTLAAIRAMVEDTHLNKDNGGPLDIGITRIYKEGGGKLLPITASSSSQEGARPTFAILDETHHWSATNGGKKLARVIRRNLGKSRDGAGRAIETTNAHEPGENSVAEDSYQAHLAIVEGRAKPGLLYDSREAPGDVDLGDEERLLAALRVTYGDATWIDLERILGEIYDPDTPPEEARRFYLNQIVAAANAWTAPSEWDSNFAPDLEPLQPGETVCLGFDGGLTDDATAIVAMRVDDGAPFLLHLQEKPDGPAGKDYHVDKDRVREAVDHAFATYDVVAFFADVAFWESDVDHWRATYGEQLLVKATTRHSVAWDMRSHKAETVRAVEALHRAILDGLVPHGPSALDDGRDGNAILRRHVLNARRRLSPYGITFGKENRESPKKVDALAALILARMARQRLLAEGSLNKRKRKRTGRLIGF